MKIEIVIDGNEYTVASDATGSWREGEEGDYSPTPELASAFDAIRADYRQHRANTALRTALRGL